MTDQGDERSLPRRATSTAADLDDDTVVEDQPAPDERTWAALHAKLASGARARAARREDALRREAATQKDPTHEDVTQEDETVRRNPVSPHEEPTRRYGEPRARNLRARDRLASETYDVDIDAPTGVLARPRPYRVVRSDDKELEGGRPGQPPPAALPSLADVVTSFESPAEPGTRATAVAEPSTLSISVESLPDVEDRLGSELSLVQATGEIPTVTAVAGRHGEYLPVGTSVGRYVVLGALAVGGMGVVYTAYDPELDRKVALKLMRVNPGRSVDKACARLLREAQALARLAHPNVIAVYDAGRLGEQVFVAMELVEGVTLRRWLDEETPALSDILAAFWAAGQGLAAAHAAGLVHRDFKPENVMMGADGRVRVLDFGLARAAQQAADSSLPGSDSPPDAEVAGAGVETAPEPAAEVGVDTTVDDDAHGEDPHAPLAQFNPAAVERPGTLTRAGVSNLASRRVLHNPLTAHGALVGTPGYMAPEQYGGGSTDARTDQFSFCVALYEAVCGHRPFSGTRPEEVAYQMASGQIEPPPPQARTPAWLVTMMIRGLSAEPEQRYPSMNHLLADLEHGMQRGARLVRMGTAIGIAALVMMVVVGAAFLVTGERARSAALCQGSEERLATVWNDDLAATVAAGFAASGRPHASEAFEQVAREIETYGRDWVAIRVDTCEATHIRGERSEAMLDLSMSCLDRRLGTLRALTGVFVREIGDDGGLDGAVVDRALGAVRQLPGLRGCTDELALRDTYPMPGDPELRQAIATLTEDVDDVEARIQIGQYRAVSESLARLVQRADELDFPPLQARTRYLSGQTQHALGNLSSAEIRFHEAVGMAAEARDDRLLAALWTKLMWLVGAGQGRYQEALRMRPMAAASISRAGGDGALEADLLAHAGMLLARLGENAEAESMLRRAVDLGTATLGADHPQVSKYMSFLGELYFAQADYDMALESQERLIETTQDVCGAEHLFLVEPLISIGRIHTEQSRFQEALGRFQQAAAIERANLGDDAPGMARHLLDIGLAQLMLGDHDAAEKALDQAWQIADRAYPADHPRLAEVLLGRGRLHMARGQLGVAENELERARVICEATFGRRHERHAEAVWHLGAVALARGALDLAEERFREALAVREALLAPDHPAVAEALHGLGRTLVATGAYDQAEAALQRALSIYERREEGEGARAAAVLADLGAMWAAQGEHASALDQLSRALALKERVLGADHPDLAATLTALGRVHLALGDPEVAAVSLRRAMTIREARPGPALALARTRLALARALCAARLSESDLSEARKLATRARAELLEADIESRPQSRLAAQLDAVLTQCR
ncbi:tetratricopeptide repeat protein [Haliangium sp.]|uniref:serine/threonine-protein kinase n=1 Tax=Haliangium sp. TaxID=2663208 RepID=UPI003D113F01